MANGEKERRARGERGASRGKARRGGERRGCGPQLDERAIAIIWGRGALESHDLLL